MVEFSDDLEGEIRREVKKFNRSIAIPEGLTEDEAVMSVIEQYKKQTGVELSDVDVRATVREQMNGRDTT